MRSRIYNLDFSKNLLLAGMVAMSYFSWLPMVTNEVFAIPDRFAMSYFSWLPMVTNEVFAIPDRFGIGEIYPTANNGSVWYINNEDPQRDGNFYFRSLEDIDLDEKDPGEFKMDAETGTQKHGVRIHVDSPKGEWKNVEMSGYFKMLDGEDEFTMIARHGPSYHDDGGCEAYGYYGMLSIKGDAFFKKKTYHHGGGYTGRTAVAEGVVDELHDRWVGIKFMVYDVSGGDVKLELWVDDGDGTNNWKKVTEYIDDGTWETDESHCDRPKDFIIDSGTRASFRVDDSEFEFKKLSIREIEPLQPASQTFLPYSIQTISGKG